MSEIPTYEEIEEAFDNGDLSHDYPPSVWEAYANVTETSLEDLVYYSRKHAGTIGDNYVGYFESYRAFIEDSQLEPGTLPSWLSIDWKGSWERDLRHSHFFHGDERDGDGHYFTMF